jgi:hypothetical protein
MPYDELGNYIPDDTLTLDEMQYALLHSGQKAPPPGYEYAKPGRMPLRANGSDVPMLPEEVAQTLVPIPPPEPKKPYSTATNFPQAVADRLGISAIPQAIMAMGAGFGSEIAKGTGNKELSEAMRYEPTSRITNDVLAGLEQAPKTITGSHMGFGPMPETWVTGMGTVSPNDIRVLAKQNIERAREAARIPEDFRNAQSGIRRESALGGDTYGAALQRAADDLADLQARNQARRSEYATPMSGSVEVFGNLMPENAMYAVRPNKSGSQVLREVPTPLNPAYSVTGESRLSEDLTDIVDRQEPRTQDEKSYQHLNQFTNFVPGDFNKSAQTMFHDFVQPILAQEFPRTPTADHSRAIHAKYGNNANEWYKKQLEAFALTPEAKMHNEKAFQVAMSDPDIPDPFEFLKDVLIIPPSAHFASKKASDAWIMNNLQNYLVEHLGTPGDPIPRLIAETGRVPMEEGRDRLLTHNQRIDDQVKDLRAKAGMPTEGTYERELDRTRNLLGQNNMVIQMLQDKENELIAAHPGVRPQDIPGWKEARKEVVQATKRKDETAKKFDNLMMAQSYENYSDLELSIADEKRFTENLEPYFKERFPMLPTNKDIAFQMRVPGPYRELARDIQNRLAISGAPGISGIEGAKNLIKAADVGTHTVPKAVQIKAELMAQREKMGEQAAKLAEQKLMGHTKKRMEAMPQDGVYGPATVVRINKDLGPEQIKADLSDITEWMDHCAGRGGSPDKKILSPKAKALGAANVPEQMRYRVYTPTVQAHLNNRVPQGSSGSINQYMKDVIKGEADIVDFRDTDTGVPFATLKLVASRTHPGMYQFDEFYGYRDKEVTGPWAPTRNTEYTPEENNAYRQVIADWANDHQSQLKPATSEYLIIHAKVYDTASNDHKSKLTNAFHAKKDEVNEVLYQMNKRFVSYPEFKEALDNFKSNPPETLDNLIEKRDDLQMRLTEAEDPEATMGLEQMEDLRHQIQDLDSRIAAMENRPPVGAREVVQVRPEAINFLANDIVTPNAAFRNQTVESIASSIRDQLLPTIDRYNPVVPGDRAHLEQELRSYQTGPLDTPLNEGIEQYIAANPGQENRIRESVADFMIDQIQQRLENRTNETQAQNQVAMRVNESYVTVRNALQHLVDANDVEAMQGIADNIMTNQNGPYGQLDDTQRIRLRQQLYDAIDNVRSRQETTPLEDIVQMDMNRVRDNYDTEVYNEVDGTLSAIHDNYDINEDPALFIERVRQHADRALAANDTTMHSIYENLASILTRTLQENNAIADARRRIQNGQAVEQARDLINVPISDTELQTVERSLRDPLSTAMASPPQVFDAYNAVIQDIGRTDTPEDALQHLSVVRSILLDPETDLQADFSIDGPEDRQLLDALITRHGDAIRELIERDQETYALDDNMLDDVASDYLNNLDNPTPQTIRQEASDMRNGMVDLPELRELPNHAQQQARDEIAYRMEQHADMDEWEPEEPQRLPATDQDLTAEQAAMREALQFPRHWYQRYPNLPQEIVTGIMTRLNDARDLEGMRVEARNRTRGTIFAGLNHNAREDAVRMIDEIGNRYQNELNARDNEQQGDQYGTAVGAYHGILRANDWFQGEEGLNSLRALPQLLTRENLRQSFGIENLNQGQLDDLLHRFNNLIRIRTEANQNPQLPPPGHKHGGYIKKKMMKNGGEYNLPDLGNDEEEPKHSKPFQPPAIPYAYPGIKGAKINRAIPLDRNSAITMSADVSRRQDQGGTNYNVNEFGGGYHHKVGPGMLGISGSHRPGTHENRVNLMYAIPMNGGGRVEPSSQSSSIDEALQQPGLKHKFTSEDILKNYGDSVFESYDKSKARKNLEPIVLKEIMSPTDSYDDGQHLMNRKSVPLGKADSPAVPTGQSFEDFQRQHMHRLRPEEVSRRGNTGIKHGGAVDIDQMRYELTRK